ncbi:rRNA (guanine-N1)-methyltransferase [Paenibacillus sp. CAA11]|nr:rRNA (guanine-N1)-methyltransferase [Paenibacillus sp. CAA11]
MPHAAKTKYDKALFKSRRRLSEAGCFDILTAEIAEMVMEHGLAEAEEGPAVVMDAGCGEGALLRNIQQRLLAQGQYGSMLGIGVDISKEGITMAAGGNPQMLWCVADLAKCPIADKRIHLLLNILSPSNYAEFHRMLADRGMILKVIPGSKYLQELRDIFYKQTDRAVYSNQRTLDLFQRSFELEEIRPVRYTLVLENQHLEALIHMTPLSWGVSPELVQQVVMRRQFEVTFDYLILLGRKKKN